MNQSVKHCDMEKLSKYKENLYKNPGLTYLFFELADAYNLSCIHCGSNACPEKHTYLPIESVKMVLHQVLLVEQCREFKM